MKCFVGKSTTRKKKKMLIDKLLDGIIINIEFQVYYLTRVGGCRRSMNRQTEVGHQEIKSLQILFAFQRLIICSLCGCLQIKYHFPSHAHSLIHIPSMSPALWQFSIAFHCPAYTHTYTHN